MAVSEKSEMSGTKEPMFGPLTFENSKGVQILYETQTKCLLCQDTFNLIYSLDIFMKHLFDVHNIVIEDFQNIENFPEYINYWRERFKNTPVEEIVPSIDVEVTGEKFYLLSTLQEDDKNIRHKLKLEYALKVQEFERVNKNYVRQCLFCKLMYEGNRQGYLEHLSSQHNLQLGNPQNLVFIEELVEKIDKKLNDLNCIYCEKTFTDRNTLKEHMRKKLHKRVNPSNTDYDKYYIVNYLEIDKNWQDVEKENDNFALPRDQNSDEEYSDWNEKEVPINCLFCDKNETNINNLCLHMEGDHNFDWVLETQSLDFYQKVKLVNYIRRQGHRKMCLYCDKEFKSMGQLYSHLVEESHFKGPELKVFDQPEYYFPTYENDAFLYFIEDLDD